jgi:hypothetical protein
MTPFQYLVALYALLALVGYGFVLRWEHNLFRGRGLARSWLAVRLATLPIALFVGALVWLPARATSGMEALAVFYLLLLLAAPLAWFGAHALVGRLLRPPVPLADTVLIAATPVLYLLAVAGVGHSLQVQAWLLLRWLGLA